MELTIRAGYQLDPKAFGFLSLLAATEDPIRIMSSAVESIEELHEKPMFIDRAFLEQFATENAQPETLTGPSNEEHVETATKTAIVETTRKISAFDAVAKGVESRLEIIEDPTKEMSSEGTINDFLDYFRDRFRRMEKLLRQRIDVKTAASVIDALRAPANTRLKIICMITEKRESKNRTILTVEDLQTSATVLVAGSASSEVHMKARHLLLDQVVCLAVSKTRSSLLLAEDIILPEVGQKTQKKAEEPIYAVLTSDIHVGSTQFQKEAFNRFILWLNGKHGNDQMKEIAGKVKYVLIAGDIVDGVGIYPNQIKELIIKDIFKQYRIAAKYLEQIPDYVEVVIIPGNHDASRKALPQPAISNAPLEALKESRNVRSLGNPSTVAVHGVEVLMYHGRSLDDVIASVPEMNHNSPEKAMKLLLQGRHMAPIYGGKTTLSPEKRDFLVIERVPDIFHAGHIHALGTSTYRGVLIANSGGWQSQTDYMRKLCFTPTPGKVIAVNLQTLEPNQVSFT